MSAPNLLNDDGAASMATLFMMAHHGFRRDLARFARALATLASGDANKAEALRSEWQCFRNSLHRHHMMEDTRIFPHLSAQHASVAPVIAALSEEHHRIDPLLERGDRAFEALPDSSAAKTVIAQLEALLPPHLAREEAEVVPFLRGAKDFPAPATDAEVELYAQGFAWSSHGVAAEVLSRVDALLPENLVAKLAAVRADFDKRCERAWGSAQAGSATTPIPNGP